MQDTFSFHLHAATRRIRPPKEMQDRSNRTGGRTIQSDVDTTRPARRQSGYTPAVPALAAGRGRIGWFSSQYAPPIPGKRV